MKEFEAFMAHFGFWNPALLAPLTIYLQAGAAMAFSSVSVVTNSLRLKRWRPASSSEPVGARREREAGREERSDGR